MNRSTRNNKETQLLNLSNQDFLELEQTNRKEKNSAEMVIHLY